MTAFGGSTAYAECTVTFHLNVEFESSGLGLEDARWYARGFARDIGVGADGTVRIVSRRGYVRGHSNHNVGSISRIASLHFSVTQMAGVRGATDTQLPCVQRRQV